MADLHFIKKRGERERERERGERGRERRESSYPDGN